VVEGIVGDESGLGLVKESSVAFEGNLVDFDRIKTLGLFGRNLISLGGCLRWIMRIDFLRP
jgi:hypothetical protein